ncbi:hypothetical protein N0V88_007649 [Collariella sp. IMI 366227]|nr:hypothetical protein N0V88_007649 [Collariella sp. IMI 366227]
MANDELDPMTPPTEFLAACPRFRILVLGNPESTKQELFTKVFGVALEKKLVDEAFTSSQNIDHELDLYGQNKRVAIHTSLNFNNSDEHNYDRVCNFLRTHTTSAKQEEHIHSIWYCVASEEGRSVAELEKRFFTSGLQSAAPHVPVTLVFTKYEEFVNKVRLDWSHDAEQRGLSKLAVSHILRDLSSKKFESNIGKKWDAVLNGAVPRVCVWSGDSDEGARSFEALADVTLSKLRERSVRYAFAAAQRSSAMTSTRFAADTASHYFEVDTGHARKLHGIDMRDILPNFFCKAVQLFNLHDPSGTLSSDPTILLPRVLDAAFGPSQRGLVTECLRKSSTEPGTILSSLSPHERAVLLTQALAAAVLFLHRLAVAQWPRHLAPSSPADPSGFLSLSASPPTKAMGTAAPLGSLQNEIERAARDISHGSEGKAVLAAVEASTIFTTCTLRRGVADLIVKAVEQAERIGERSWKAGE